MLSDEQIKSYQIIRKKYFDKDMLENKIYQQASALLRIVELIYKPITETEYQDLQKRSKNIESTH